jgi:hypothetical protein
MTNAKTKVYFIDGYSPTRGLLGLIAFPIHLKGQDIEFTRFYTTLNGQWLQMKFDFDTRSLTYLTNKSYKAWWLLGKRGEVVEIRGGIPRIENIDEAGTGPGKLGYLNKIAVIDGEIYACGYHRQVYKRQDGSWQHLGHGVIDKSLGATFESMAGSGPRDIYAVGSSGDIWHYDGQLWRRCDSPTNQHLLDIHYANSEEIYVCGKNGVLLRGSKDKWDVIKNEDFSQDLWGVEVFNNQVYVASFMGLGIIIGDTIKPLDLGLRRQIAGYRLRQSEGILWSIGNDDIVYFDGQNWTELICPDNA